MNAADECLALIVALIPPKPHEQPVLTMKPPTRDQHGHKVCELTVSIDHDPARARSVTLVGGGDNLCAALAYRLRGELAARGIKRSKAS
jgi:hypothetical protein